MPDQRPADDLRVIVLTLQPLTRPVPVVIRLRTLLKALLRCWGFRCLSVTRTEAPPSPGEPPA